MNIEDRNRKINELCNKADELRQTRFRLDEMKSVHEEVANKCVDCEIRDDKIIVKTRCHFGANIIIDSVEYPQIYSTILMAVKNMISQKDEELNDLVNSL